jgi:hypothetical protein
MVTLVKFYHPDISTFKFCNPLDPTLYSWITECLNTYARQNQIKEPLSITQLWLNEDIIGQMPHDHNGNFLVGCLYFTSGSSIYFIEDTEETDCVIEPGMLLLFPGGTMHGTRPHTENYTRKCLAFNVNKNCTNQ